MDELPLDVFTLLAAYLDDRSTGSLTAGNALYQGMTTLIKKDILYWKQKVELELNVSLAEITTDQWENIYKKIINAVDLNKLLGDPITHHLHSDG